MIDNPYKTIIKRNLPRLLAQYLNESGNPYFGCGDRRYWAWKLIDFPNGTFQGAALGLARLYNGNFFYPDQKPLILKRIDAMIRVLPKMMEIGRAHV